MTFKNVVDDWAGNFGGTVLGAPASAFNAGVLIKGDPVGAWGIGKSPNSTEQNPAYLSEKFPKLHGAHGEINLGVLMAFTFGTDLKCRANRVWKPLRADRRLRIDPARLCRR